MPRSATHHRSSLFLLAPLLLAFSGCHVSVHADELQGTWMISRSSQPLFPDNFDVTTATFILRPDKTFTATALPAEIVAFGSVDPKTQFDRIDGAGTWAIFPGRLFEEDRFMLDFQSIRGPGHYTVPLGVMIFWARRSTDGVTIFYFQGDPDLGRRVDFAKQK